MKYEYKKLMQNLINTSEDLNQYSKNEGSLSEESKKQLQELDKKIHQTIKKIKNKESKK